MVTYSGDFPIAVHPGEILREMLAERGVTQVELAKHLGSNVARVREICRGRRGVSAQMAAMLGKAFPRPVAQPPEKLGVESNRWDGRKARQAASEVRVISEPRNLTTHS